MLRGKRTKHFRIFYLLLTWVKQMMKSIPFYKQDFVRPILKDSDVTSNPLLESDKGRIKLVHRERFDIESRCNSCPMQEHRHGTWLVEWHNSKS